MQGQHKYQPKLFVQIDIEKLIPQNHLLHKIDQILDLSFVRELTKEYYDVATLRVNVKSGVWLH